MNAVYEMCWKFSFTALIFKQQNPVCYLLVLQSPELWKGTKVIQNDIQGLNSLEKINIYSYSIASLEKCLYLAVEIEISLVQPPLLIQESSSVIPHLSVFDKGFKFCYLCVPFLSWVSVDVCARWFLRLLSDPHRTVATSACCTVTKSSWMSVMLSACTFGQLLLPVVKLFVHLSSCYLGGIRSPKNKQQSLHITWRCCQHGAYPGSSPVKGFVKQENNAHQYFLSWGHAAVGLDSCISVYFS